MEQFKQITFFLSVLTDDRRAGHFFHCWSAAFRAERTEQTWSLVLLGLYQCPGMTGSCTSVILKGFEDL